MREESLYDAEDTRERRLFRPVLPLHTRTSGHDQGGSQATGKHDRVRARAHRRPPDHVWAAKPSGRSVGGGYEESQNRDAPRIRSASVGPEVSDALGGTSTFEAKQAMTVGLPRQLRACRIFPLLKHKEPV